MALPASAAFPPSAAAQFSGAPPSSAAADAVLILPWILFAVVLLVLLPAAETRRPALLAACKALAWIGGAIAVWVLLLALGIWQLGPVEGHPLLRFQFTSAIFAIWLSGAEALCLFLFLLARHRRRAIGRAV